MNPTFRVLFDSPKTALPNSLNCKPTGSTCYFNFRVALSNFRYDSNGTVVKWPRLQGLQIQGFIIVV